MSLPDGFRRLQGYLDTAAQQRLLEDIRRVIRRAPFYTPEMPRTGRPLSVAMTNCGSLGWVTDKTGGYRYQTLHPVTGEPWPEIPASLLGLWQELADYASPPEACLVNYYGPAARMGAHQDRDEETFEAPVLSVRSSGVSTGVRCR